jgi:hypothetical protein
MDEIYVPQAIDRGLADEVRHLRVSSFHERSTLLCWLADRSIQPIPGFA